MKKVLILGATSKIAQEVTKYFAETGDELFLAGRDASKLTSVADDLRVRGARRVDTYALDLNEIERHPKLLQRAKDVLGTLDVALIAHGTLPDQSLCQQSVELTLKELTTNCLSVISLLTLLANYFEPQRHGCIAVITSVAGDRGRQSNYIYGTAKGAVDIFLQGLRNRLSKFGVTVITIKPGFVDTPMTASLPKNVLYADPSVVGKRIAEAVMKRQDVVYVPWFWRWIMMIIRLVPEAIFKRMRL